MSQKANQMWCLSKRPNQNIDASNFSWQETQLPSTLGDGEVLVRTLYLSLDPTNRLWASDMDQYMPPVRLGDVMRGATLGVVEESNNARIPVDSIVSGMWGWQSYFQGGAGGLSLVDPVPDVPLSAYISILGINGMTAFFGLFDVGQAKASDSVVVSAAAGSVGSLVGQMAKIHGCRVVGIAGSDEKCRWLTEELGFDAAINYKLSGWSAQLSASCPDGVDLYFDNVGGEVTDVVIDQMNSHARIAVCGMISRYNEAEPWSGPKNYGMVLMRSLTIRGFLVSDYFKRFSEGMRIVATWLSEGRLQYSVEIVEGLENAPQAIDRLFLGTNTGKLLVRCSPE